MRTHEGRRRAQDRHYVPQHAAVGKFGTFTFGDINVRLSFEWLVGKRRWLRGGALYQGLTNKIYKELHASHAKWSQNPSPIGRHSLAERPAEQTMMLRAVS